jgi:vitellogenic carboxypeptidase-like protein
MHLLPKLAFLLVAFNFANCQDVGEPLYLTPYIKSGQIEEAKQLALVRSNVFSGIKSYTGFITVNETYGSNMFFWFIPSAVSPRVHKI